MTRTWQRHNATADTENSASTHIPRLPAILLGIAVLLGAGPALASEALGHELSLLWVAPFVLMLLVIALAPLLLPHWWEKNRNKAVPAIVLSLPVAAFLLANAPHELVHTGKEYLSFLVLLGSLFVISGGIRIRMDVQATPAVNTAFLLLGAVLASFMGTTGAAMLLVRPLLDTNQQRTRVTHTVIFFIFMVGNTGGCLTPLGDPPLFMGYLAGVPFSWFFRLWPEWALVNLTLAALYFVIDRYQYAREPEAALMLDRARVRRPEVLGLLNLPLLLGVVLSVAFLHEGVVPFPVREIVLSLLAAASWKLTPRVLREENRFTFHPIVEVAVLFAGIFVTMIPALLILRARGAELGIESPMSYFWATGMLSSFLDNTPTFVVFFALGQAVGSVAGQAPVANTGIADPLLRAVSLGAVFMGANTYIGNAPNFMIKSIAEERKIKMPSFFGYMLYPLLILLPLFLLVSWLFL
ncbi:MAG: sodium:proton antiporter [Myxococcales bacterium]|nr:sodium:proton antiporter [Myxococcales bacterium]